MSIVTTILLVDDEVPFVNAMTRRLRRRRLEILTAHSGPEALDTLAESPVDVVVLDVRMPGMDGMETLREMKQDHPLVEVIMLTGHATIETGMEGMMLGAFDYLMKPCDMEVLLVKVGKARRRKFFREERIAQAWIRDIALRRCD